MLFRSIRLFGSLEAATGYLSGDAILVDSHGKFGGRVPADDSVDVYYRLSNSTSQPVRVLGAKATCSCIGILDLPVTISPGGATNIRLRVHGRNPGTVQRESAELILDAPKLRIVLDATVVVRPKTS